MRQPESVSRREFLAFGIGGTLFGWLPWFKPKFISLAGAEFQIVRKKHARRHFVVIHGDEETARQVLADYIKTHPGIAFLIEGHTRDVEILSGQIDPNRMFSRTGAEASLRRLNPKWNQQDIDEALDLLDQGREKLLRQLFPGHHHLLMALHNNSEAYSVNDELGIANAHSLPQPNNPHAFFLCTDPNDYRILTGSPYNVVLQNNVRAADDGSLSRRAAARFARYVNLEVRRGDAELQRTMLAWADENLR